MANEIVLEGVWKAYPGCTALADVDLTLPGDRTTAIVGPSGSGKSTLLQLINGLVRPDRGHVRIDGQLIDYDHLPELRRSIGYAVQGTGLFPHLTVMQNITLLAKLSGWERLRIRARAEELMRLVDLPLAFAERYPHELSGGEQQRVGLCRAMMLNPKIFLLDEPFGALDSITRSEIHEEFLKLQQLEPRTIVLVTHDLREALKLAQHLVILRRGRVVQTGRCDHVVRHPASEFVSYLFQSQVFETPYAQISP